MRIVPFTASHANTLRLQRRQLIDGPLIEAEARQLELVGPCYSLLDDAGRCLGAAGLIPQWPGRAVAWALLSEDIGPHFVRVVREMRRYLGACDFVRVEASADAEFPAAQRLLELLGFERETPEPMRHYAPDGRPAYQYARINVKGA